VLLYTTSTFNLEFNREDAQVYLESKLAARAEAPVTHIQIFRAVDRRNLLSRDFGEIPPLRLPVAGCRKKRGRNSMYCSLQLICESRKVRTDFRTKAKCKAMIVVVQHLLVPPTDFQIHWPLYNNCKFRAQKVITRRTFAARLFIDVRQLL
jgi:hypothetical protein